MRWGCGVLLGLLLCLATRTAICHSLDETLRDPVHHLHHMPLATVTHFTAKKVEEKGTGADWESFLELVEQTTLADQEARMDLQPFPHLNSVNNQPVTQNYRTVLQKILQLQNNRQGEDGGVQLQGASRPLTPSKPNLLDDIVGVLKRFFEALLRVIMKGIPTLYDSFMNAGMDDLGCHDPLGRYYYGTDYGRRMFPKTFSRYQDMLKKLVPKVQPGEQCILPVPDFQPIKNHEEGGGPFGALWGGMVNGPGFEDPAGRGWGPNVDLPESQYCYTLLETYMRMCAAPERMFFLETNVSTVDITSEAREKMLRDYSNRTEDEPKLKQDSKVSDQSTFAVWSLDKAASMFLEIHSNTTNTSQQTTTTHRRHHHRHHIPSRPVAELEQLPNHVQSFGTRPLSPASPSKPFIGELLASIFEAVFTMVMKVIISVVGVLCEVLIPIIFDVIVGGFGPIIFILVPLFLMRFIPILLNGYVSAQRPPGFSGPDPYDAFGPDSPEPKPFKKPAMEMCYRLLDTWTYKCNVPKEY